MKICSCPIGVVKGDCPFSYDNGWHARRAAMLLEIDPTVYASVPPIPDRPAFIAAKKSYVFDDLHSENLP